jgi:PAS domain S-box-containing protein
MQHEDGPPASLRVLARSDSIRFLSEIDERLFSTPDLRETMQNIVECFVPATCDFCVLFQYDELTQRFRETAALHADSGKTLELESAAGQGKTRGCPELCKAMSGGEITVLEGPDLGQLEDLCVMQDASLRRIAVLPLQAYGHSAGVAICGQLAGDGFDIQLLGALALRAGIALDHAVMHRRLLQAENRFASIMDSNVVGVSIHRHGGTIIEANERFLEILGLDRKAIGEGLNIRRVTPQEYQQATTDAMREIMDCGRTGPFHKEYVRPDGSRVDALVVGTALEGDVGDLMTFVVDVTHQRKTERHHALLNRASKHLSATFDLQVSMTSLANVLVPEMASLCSIYILDSGKAVPLVIHHEDPKVSNLVWHIEAEHTIDLDNPTGIGKVFGTGEPSSIPDFDPKLGLRWDERQQELIEALQPGSMLSVPLKQGAETLGALMLISSQPRRYDEYDVELMLEIGRRAGLAIEHSKRFKSIGKVVEARTQDLQNANRELESFAYSVSHDLRAPLRSIMSSSMILLEDYGDRLDEEGKAELLRSAAAAKRMSQLIDDLLEYSRLGRREMSREEVNLSALALAVAHDIGIPDKALHVQSGMIADADPDLLRVLLTNLLENAWKFSQGSKTPRVEVKSKLPGTFVVKDNGVGFDQQYVDKLFMPFERLHSLQEYPGTGVGLANVKRIVSRHHGKVWALGKVGEGAEISFTLADAEG